MNTLLKGGALHTVAGVFERAFSTACPSLKITFLLPPQPSMESKISVYFFVS